MKPNYARARLCKRAIACAVGMGWRSFVLFAVLLIGTPLALFADGEKTGKELIDTGKITFTGNPEKREFADGSVALKFTDTEEAATITFGGLTMAKVLLVGGGGAGGMERRTTKAAIKKSRGSGGGGGAGGMLEVAAESFSGGEYAIVVGKGGEAVMATEEASVMGKPGYPSKFVGSEVNYIAFGGGGGGAECAGGSTDAEGNPAGSGGGGSRYYETSSESKPGGSGNQGSVGGIGNAGGDGNAGGASAGGGGAGAAAGDATSQYIATDGGAGISSWIFAEDEAGAEYYAGGGGGSSESSGKQARIGGQGGGGRGAVAKDVEATSGANGFGGGGGGGSMDFPGGAGGSGVVIVRIIKGYEGDPIVPINNLKFTYGGTNILGAASGAFTVSNDTADVKSQTSAAEVGNYYYYAISQTGKWSDGSSDIKRIDWQIVPLKVTKPTAHEDFTYDGTEKCGAVPDDNDKWYTLSETKVATNACEYTFYAALNNPEGKVNLTWEDGSTLPVELKWKIARAPVAKPELIEDTFVYNEGLRTVYSLPAADEGKYTLGGDITGTNVDQYRFVATLNANYKWADGSLDELSYDWEITKAPNEISSLSFNGWMTGTQPSAEPSSSANFGTVLYRYCAKPSVAWEEAIEFKFSEMKALPAGEYVLLAKVEGTKNYEEALASVEFGVWSNPNEIFTDKVDFTFASGKVDPIKVEFSECAEVAVQARATDLAGFTYARAGVDGTALAFLDEKGQLLDYSVESWKDADALSTLWVKPKENASAKITMFWNLRKDKVAPGTNVVSKVANPRAIAFGLVETDCEKVEGVYQGLTWNYWTEVPAITPAVWDAGAAPGEIYQGTVKCGSGQIKVAYSNAYEEVECATMPTEGKGTYRAYFTVDLGPQTNVLLRVVEFKIVEHSPYDDLANGGGLSASGRVLLMNNDKMVGHEVTNQGYPDTDTTTDSYWEILDMDNVPSEAFDATVGTIGNGSEFVYWIKNRERRLWHLENCRFGNTLPNNSDTSTLNPTFNFLPFSETALRFNSKSSALRYRRRDAGQILMMNTIEAVINSGCYLDGIGTVYFDAVNAVNCNNPHIGIGVLTNAYMLAVEWSTNAVNAQGNSVWPTDAAAMFVDGESTNLYGRLEWHEAKFMPLYINGSTVTATNLVTEFSPEVTEGGTMERFYRFVVPLNFDVPARFRIVRRRVDEKNKLLDGYGYILLDNIIVSKPRMSADLAPAGFFDATRKGKRVLGYENAFSSAFPAVGEQIYGAASAIYNVNDATDFDTTEFITGAKMHYRWRYLDQKLEPAIGWRVADMNPKTLRTLQPLDIPVAPGDIEYWFDADLQAPYFKYVDYSGSLAKDKPVGDYTEELSAVTNKAGGAKLDSKGTDWFTRLREAKSDYEDVYLVCRLGDNEQEVRYPMDLVVDNTWRVAMPTPEPIVNGIEVRFELVNRQAGNFAEWATNVTYGVPAQTIAELPFSGALDFSNVVVYTNCVCDGITGHLLFQVDVNARTLSVVHASYQDFNNWTDAAGDKFLGSSTTNEHKTGVSPKKQTFTESFEGWQVMSATNSHWSVPTYTDINHLYGHKPYETFASDTNDSWFVGQGMWVAKHYREDADYSGVAIQMEGCGKGYLQFSDTEYAPRGLESISFNARLGQFLDFEDFAYYLGESPMRMKNYTFAARVAFDANSNKDFSGNASLSMAAYYRQDRGAYEARWEYIGKNLVNSVAKNKGQRLALYRWNKNSAGQCEETLLAAWTNTVFELPNSVPLDSIGALYMPMAISVKNNDDSTRIVIAVGTKGLSLEEPTESLSSTNWCGICYVDKSVNRHTSGTYGVVSANCPGIFGLPQYDAHSITNNFGMKATDEFKRFTPDNLVSTGKDKWGVINVANNSGGMDRCYTDFAAEGDDCFWIIQPGRMSKFIADGSIFARSHNGLVASPVVQQLYVETSSPGKLNWTLLKTIDLDSFGSPTEKIVLPLYTTDDCSVRFRVGGTIEDVRSDVVIDSVVLKQWRGDDYVHFNKFSIPNWTDQSYLDGHSNFVFTSAWIVPASPSNTNRADLLLSPKRTAEGTPSSVRTPLMDGYERRDGTKRGSGLGMLSFSYRDADSAARLLVQIATNNISTGSMTSIDTFSEDVWTTVTNFDFSAMSSDERKAGTCEVYFGLHGIAGLARILVDTNVVAEAVSAAKGYGDIYITKLLCLDEPDLDAGCWWGWNMRTVGESTAPNDYLRTYLPDYSVDVEARGLSAALNNSLTKDVDSMVQPLDLKQNKPFVQTPTFVSNIVGEVSFKARKYDGSTLPAIVRIEGSSNPNGTQSDWEYLSEVVVSNATFESYSYKTKSKEEIYKAFRLSVPGVAGVVNPAPLPDGYDSAVRVLLDEVMVSEKIECRMGFKNVGAFRSELSGVKVVRGVPSAAEQPLCNESWGVQAEIYGAMLAEEIDFERIPSVRLLWFEGVSPWGYENWRDNPRAHAEYLSRCPDNPMVYRSSYQTSPRAVVEMSTSPGSVVQYMLEVVYYRKDSNVPVTNRLSSADWTRPDWYAPIDYNQQFGKTKNDFAAYNILDMVAPKWAWINEVNIFGTYDNSWNNSDAEAQYVEIAAPQEADLSGWSIRMLEPLDASDRIMTNVVGVFGSTLPAQKKNLAGAADTMVFHVLATPKAKGSTSHLDINQGEVDGYWTFSNNTSTYPDTGEIYAIQPISIQLVRSSGIVEHEIVAIGTNFWGTTYDDMYNPNEHVKYYNNRGSSFFYAGNEDGGSAFAWTDRAQGQNAGTSLSVSSSRGENATCWTNLWHATPGRINEGQRIDNHPTPNGESIIVYANVTGAHIKQTIGDAVDSTSNQMVILPKGSLHGTNILYRTDPWYELSPVNVTTGKLTWATVGQLQAQRTWIVNVGAGCSNNVTVTAAATPLSMLVNDYGLDANNNYTPAVLDWLERGSTLKGPFANPQADKIYLANYCSKKGKIIRPLSLTQMYWLDIDPTVGEGAMEFWAGMATCPKSQPRDNFMGSGVNVENKTMGVFMMITNRVSDKAWTPYVIRGLEPRSHSQQYVAGGDFSWAGATFKITGILANGVTNCKEERYWQPQRWFVFAEDSFNPLDASELPGISMIEVIDPYSTFGAGYAAGWYDWVQEHGLVPVWYWFSIDTRIKPVGVEVLKQENYYEDK